MKRSDLAQLRHLLRPLAIRIANTVSRAVVNLADDAKKLQALQLGLLDDETADDGERFAEYGFTSVPLEGAEAVAVFPNGDRSQPIVIATDDRRHRPTGLNAGEVMIYNNAGASVKLTSDGDVICEPASGRKLYVRTSGGSTDALVTKTELDAHVHPSGTGPTGIVNPPFTGTAAIEVE